MMRRSGLPRLFLDSNVILAGFLSAWGLDKAILSIGAARVVRLVVADVVKREVETALLIHADVLDREDIDQLLGDYELFFKLARPEIVPAPSHYAANRSRSLIRHLSDVPVLVSAMNARPDWFITNNTRHFDRRVAQTTDLRIATPRQFFKALAEVTLQ
jgi:predicted nucleic acid-binding protein